MGTINEFLARIPERTDAKRDWRRMARMGKLVLYNLDGMDFVLVRIEEPNPPGPVLAPTNASSTLDVIKGDVIVRLMRGHRPNVLPRLRQPYDPPVTWREHLRRHQASRFPQGS